MSSTRQLTAADHWTEAVEAAVAKAAANLTCPVSIDEMASVACLSKYYFVRVFRQVTGLTPARFVTALRLREASRLLLLSDLSVVDVSTAVGYSSVATFTHQYRRYSGFSPRNLRKLASCGGPDKLANLFSGASPDLSHSDRPLRGKVTAPFDFSGVIVIGLFPERLAGGLPTRCTACAGAGSFLLNAIPDGQHWVMATGLPADADVSSYLSPLPDSVLVDSAAIHVVTGAEAVAPVELELRPVRPSDPPVLSPLPALLLARR
jgi:AraC-like DNA-binding protein